MGVNLGLLPGLGGTQRLPRIVGIPRAIGMICSGERIGSAPALAAGLIDATAGQVAIVAGQPRIAATSG